MNDDERYRWAREDAQWESDERQIRLARLLISISAKAVLVTALLTAAWWVPSLWRLVGL